MGCPSCMQRGRAAPPPAFGTLPRERGRENTSGQRRIHH